MRSIGSEGNSAGIAPSTTSTEARTSELEGVSASRSSIRVSLTIGFCTAPSRGSESAIKSAKNCSSPSAFRRTTSAPAPSAGAPNQSTFSSTKALLPTITGKAAFNGTPSTHRGTSSPWLINTACATLCVLNRRPLESSSLDKHQFTFSATDSRVSTHDSLDVAEPRTSDCCTNDSCSAIHAKVGRRAAVRIMKVLT